MIISPWLRSAASQSVARSLTVVRGLAFQEGDDLMKGSTELPDRSALRRALRLTVLAGIAALIALPVSAAAATEGASATPAASGGGPNKVLATIGDHPVTQGEVDAKVAAQLYDLRKQALDEIIDNYVVQRAAKKSGLKPDQYLDRQVKLSTPRVTSQEAEQFYGQHKAQLDAQTGGHSFSQIETRLIAALQREHDQDGREQLIKKLRAENDVAVLLEAPRVSVASANHPSTGAGSAPVTIIEFSDFQCPFCRAAESSLKQVRQKYGDQVKLVYMDFPLGFHPHAMDAARAARCAADQDKFWQFHDALFLDQKKLDPDNLRETAAKVGLDHDKFNSCFSSDKHDVGIRRDMAEGNSLGVTGTPTFFINGRELLGALPPLKFDEVIDEELARAKEPANSRQAMK
jgi:protein-disulfide isomerase